MNGDQFVCSSCGAVVRKNFANPIAEAVFNARIIKKLTQSEFATLLGVKQSAIGAIEVGIRKPSPALALALSKATDVPIEKFIIDTWDEQEAKTPTAS